MEDGSEVVRKCYRLPGLRDRLRAFHRGGWLGTPKAVREFRTLQRLHRLDVPVVEAVWCCTQRDLLGMVRSSHLVTRRLAGGDLERHLREDGEFTDSHASALGASLSAMHQAGLWHRTAAPRNVLVLDDGIAWLDFAKSRWTSGPCSAQQRALDLLRLCAPMQAFFRPSSRSAFELAYGEEGVTDLDSLRALLSEKRRAAAQAVLDRDAARWREADSR